MRAARAMVPALAALLVPSPALAVDLRSSATLTRSNDVLWMIGLTVGCLLVLAGTDWLVGRVRQSVRRRANRREEPGRSPLRPLVVDSYDEVFRRRVHSCDCGGQPKVAFEGATRSKTGKLWLMIEICPRCQRRFQTYFDVTSAKDERPLKGAPPVTPVPR